MLLSKVKQAIEFRTKTKYKTPDDGLMQELIYEALLYVANRTDPAELVRTTETTEQILKMIEGGKCVVYPEYPDFTQTQRHLQMDELLNYSVINYACFLLTNDVKYKQLSDEDIGLYRGEFNRALYGESL